MSVLIKKYTTAFNFKLNIKYNVISLHRIEFYLIFNSICNCHKLIKSVQGQRIILSA